MEEIGIIKNTDGVMATVVVEKKSACDECKQGCKVTGGGAEIEALNLAKAEIGNTVKVQMKPFTYLKGTLLIYGFPVLALILGAIAGREWVPMYIKTVDKDLLSAFAGFLALLAAFIVARLIAVRSEKNIEMKPVVSEVIKK